MQHLSVFEYEVFCRLIWESDNKHILRMVWFLCKIWVISAEVSSLSRPFNIGHRSSLNFCTKANIISVGEPSGIFPETSKIEDWIILSSRGGLSEGRQVDANAQPRYFGWGFIFRDSCREGKSLFSTVLTWPAAALENRESSVISSATEELFWGLVFKISELFDGVMFSNKWIFEFKILISDWMVEIVSLSWDCFPKQYF